MSARDWRWHRAGPSHDLGVLHISAYVDSMSEIQIKVVLDAAHIGETDQYCQSLAAMGLSIDSSFPEIGVIFGAGDPALLVQMNAMDGVAEAVAEGTLSTLKGR